MKTQLLIATDDCDYAGHLSNILAEKHADVFDVNVYSTVEHIREQLAVRKFDVALLECNMTEGLDLESVRLPLLLCSEDENTQDISGEFKKVYKYQRISSMVSNILELYAKVLTNEHGLYLRRARITAVWSPMGGVGKTTSALAYCRGKASAGKQVMYLNLEPFSSVVTYFDETGKSISAVLEMLEPGEGNLQMLIKGIRRQESGGITYFCRPDNYDDMNIITPENVAALIEACSEVTDELVIDMSCICDERTRKIFELADRVFLVTDPTCSAQNKLAQFASQNNTFQCIRGKATLIANKGAVIGEPLIDTIVYLPYIRSEDATAVYKTLSCVSFDA